MDKFFESIFYTEFIRYFIIAGLAYWVFYSFRKDKWIDRKIQKRFPDKEHILHEIKYSIINMTMFTILGYGVYVLKQKGNTKIYNNIDDFGIPYFIFSIILLIVIHDTYFYWTHRLMHLKKIYPYVHKIHHHSINPTPWAAYSFHPYEGLINYMIMPIIVFTIPVHTYAIVFWLVFSLIENVGGHLGFELMKPGFTKRKATKWSNTVTHHTMHHKYFDYNYGLYFNIWDQLMKTNHPKYHETFEDVAKNELRD